MSGQCGHFYLWRRSCDLPKLWNLLALATLPLPLTCCCAAVSLHAFPRKRGGEWTGALSPLAVDRGRVLRRCARCVPEKKAAVEAAVGQLRLALQKQVCSGNRGSKHILRTEVPILVAVSSSDRGVG